MPLYEFRCQACGHDYEDLCPSDDTGVYPGVACPGCKSDSKSRRFSSPPTIVFTDPTGTSRADNAEYMYGHKFDKAQQLRRDAEAASHMGTSPYNHIDDLNNGDYFGEVK